MASSFLAPGTSTREGQLASLHLSHNHSVPVILSTTASNAAEEGYAEGVVTNTKFGSFPHSTLLNVPWGSQIRASKVDTGTRGRNIKKRKAESISNEISVGQSNGLAPESPGGGFTLRGVTTASSGFIHVLPPTPENWTTSLPHRTQVVYTPDYSYILHRIRARPGAVLIEAGSGSGSFTHAAVRAVYDGAPVKDGAAAKADAVAAARVAAIPSASNTRARVYTYEFHPERHEKVKIEMQRHGLDHLVTATHRDVYKDGFLLKHEDGSHMSPLATAVFLDLPAPWEALQHLTRAEKNGTPSALDPQSSVHICTFSPCIEQVQKTISSMRKLGWLEIEMVEMQHKRIDVRREFTGLKYDGMRSVNVYAADVDEAILKLRAVEQRAKAFHSVSADDDIDGALVNHATQNAQLDASKVFYKDGSIVHRSEPDIKTHTSYLVFAILPREWTAQDEEDAKNALKDNIKTAPVTPKSQRQLKKEAKQRKKVANWASKAVEHSDTASK